MDRELMENVYWSLGELRNFLVGETIESTGATSPSVMNIRHYLRLRSRDNTMLQSKLTRLGLSSLGRSQPHVVDTINRVMKILDMALGRPIADSPAVLTAEEAQELFAKRCMIFGGELNDYLYHARTRIMLTLPSEAVEDDHFIREMAIAGVNLFRINTAHDGPEVWRKMAAKIAEVNEHLPQNRRVRIYVDLAGPKIRTGSLKQTTAVMTAGAKGEKTQIELLPLSSGATTETAGASTLARIVVSNDFFEAARHAKKIALYTDGKKPRILSVLKSSSHTVLCEIDKKIEVRPGSRLEILKGKQWAETQPMAFSGLTQSVRLSVGDLILVTTEEQIGNLTEDDLPAVACSNASALSFVKVGDRVYLDDGKIALRVRSLRPEGLVCEVVSVTKAAVALKSEKGINFPDSSLEMPAITPEDRQNFESVVDFADIIGISFAQSADDIATLAEMLREKGRDDIGIVAKVETKKAVKNLPNILEALLEWPQSAIMIARGDLAIEAGFENLAWLQEEILDLAEAAHMPVILATQILESQMKSNIPSRAEVIDAGFAQRAECVMLNKGAFAMDTIKKLEYILEQMHQVYRKNIQLLGPCSAWHE
ncbi:MAG: hypothetical protein K6347_06175 [Campylobacterales bacterium]